MQEEKNEKQGDSNDQKKTQEWRFDPSSLP